MQKNIPTLFSVSEVELVYRNKVKPADRIKIASPEQAYNAFINAWDLNKIDMVEQFYALFVDRAHNCLGISNMFTGGVSSCLVDMKIIFATALKMNASSIFVAHNHPSGNIVPSRADKVLTEKIRDGGKLLDILLLDHLIVTPFKYYSFTEAGLIL
jgi:DNA repair protein RadC